MNRKAYVVTGATSFIGSGLLRRLSKEGHRIYAVCRPKSERMYRIPQSENIVKVECELNNLSDLEHTIKEKCDVFYHLGWHTCEKNNMYAQNENVKHTLDAVNAAFKLGCTTFIGAGSQAEYGLANKKLTETVPADPIMGYGMAKLCAGQMSRKMCSNLGIRHIWTRILSVYGPMDADRNLVMYIVKTLLDGKIPELSEGKQIWDFLYVDDCAEALYLLDKHGKDGQVYNVGSGEEITIKEYAEKIRKVISARIPELSSIELNFGAKPYSSETPMFLSADISKLKKDTKFEPVITFEEGINKILDGLI